MKSMTTLLAATLLAGAVTAGRDLETPQMEIGCNFWDIGWGGEKNQPFKMPYDQFEPSQDPWNPQFLEELKIYSCLRFMDWMKTNSVEREWERGNKFHKSWESRTKPTDNVQRPMAYEWMIDLCNRTGCNMWITVPHVVDDDYVRNLAKLIKKELNPELQCFVEWSNETWNGSFTQAKYVNDRGQKIPESKLEGFKFGKSNVFYTGQVYHAVRTLEVHRIFADVFGPAERNRLVLVMGGSTGHAFYEHSHLYAVNNPELNPGGIRPDAYALAPYIGHDVKPDDPEAFEKLMGPVMEKKIEQVAKISALMKANGIEMVCYEGGQHIRHTLDGAVAFQKRPEMYDLYMKYLSELSRYMTHFSHYTHTGGSWGAKEYIGEPDEQAPKYRALREWSEKIRESAQAAAVPQPEDS